MTKWTNEALFGIKIQFISGMIREYWVAEDEYNALTEYAGNYTPSESSYWYLTHYQFGDTDENNKTFVHEYINFNNVEIIKDLNHTAYIRVQKPKGTED